MNVVLNVSFTSVYCSSCNRRQIYQRCYICNKPQCALCGWTSVGKMIIAEMCRGCAEKA